MVNKNHLNCDDQIIKTRNFLGAWLRQCSGGTPPKIVPMTPALEKLADYATAQKIWDELIEGFFAAKNRAESKNK